jgi:Zn-finger nucleic acid-binding protein
MKTITCPKCRGKLESIVYQKIEVDRCRDCGGIWFDSREAEQLKMLQGSEIVDNGNPAAGIQCDRSDKELNCPRCHAKMMQILDIDEYTLWYEKCPKCQGIWFDAGEFKKFKQNFLPKSVLDLTRQVFRPKKE